MSDRDLGKTRSQLKVDNLSPNEIADILQNIQRQKESEEKAVIAGKVRIPEEKIERAIAFWKPVLFSVTKEGRQLNGIEAYELGDEKKTGKPDQAPFIAMSNLMALEAMRMMGEHWPTVEDAALLAFGTEKEHEVADFWHSNFAPLAFQAEWAWKACMAVMAGAPGATREMLEDYQAQLP